MLKNGYIFAHRSLLDWGWYKDVPTCKLWLHLLLCANYEPCEFMGEKIASGEFATSYVSLANGSGLTVKQVRNALDKLKKTGEISVRTNRHYSVITISKYDEYQRKFFANRADQWHAETVATQGFPDIREENRADRGQTEGTQRATMEEYNKAIKQESKKEKSSKDTAVIPTQEETGFSDSLYESFAMWIEYKKERRDAYKPTGLKSLVTVIRNNASKYGEDAVCRLITECMSNGWKGIIWKKLEEPKNGCKNNTGGYAAGDTGEDDPPGTWNGYVLHTTRL